MTGIAKKLSIVTICYNSSECIADTIESVLNQKFVDYEYIIIDGASTDNTLAIIQSYIDRFAAMGVDFSVYSEKDTGIYNAMNKGIVKATGEWINFLNAGDRFYDNETLSKIFAKVLDGVDVLYGSAERAFKDYTDVWRPLSITYMWRQMPFCHQSTFVRTAYHKERLFDETFRLGADYDFFFDSYYYKKKRFRSTDNVICIYDMQGQSTINSIRDAKENLKLAWKYKAFPSIMFFIFRLMYRYTLRPFVLNKKDIKRRKQMAI